MVETHDEEVLEEQDEMEEASDGELVPAEVQDAGGRDLDFGSNGDAEGGAIVPLPATPPARVDDTLPMTAEEKEWERIMHLAQFAEASGLYIGSDKKPETGIELAQKALVGQALGLSAATSFQALKKISQGINIPAELQRALAERAGYRINQVELTLETCTLQLMIAATDKVVGETTYTLDDAGKAKLLGNEVWSKYRKNMLFARATTDLISRFCARVLYFSDGDPL